MSGTYFYLPDGSNNITSADISKGALRITVSAKSYFERNRRSLKIHINGLVYNSSYANNRGKKSDILRIRTKAMNSLNIKTGNRIKITRIDFLNFKIEKI
jgi:hypothetical protein